MDEDDKQAPPTRRTRSRPNEDDPRPSLHFVTRREAFSVTLPIDGELMIGRGDQADVLLGDDSVSRRHARVSARGEAVTVEDLGSSNGTFLHDRPIAPGEPVTVGVGDVLLFGEVPCLVQGGRTTARRTWSSGYIYKRVEEHRRSGSSTPLTLLRVRVRGTVPSGFESWLIDAVGPRDVVSELQSNEALALLYGRDGGELEALVTLLRERLRAPGCRVDLVTATWPRDGDDAAALLTRTALSLREALRTQGAPEVVLLSPAMLQLHARLEQVARGTINVLLLGEMGVGKEVFAARLHELSPRAKKPYLKLNCAALTESLAESELFGHVKGAFTGATATHAGLIEAADKGTLFLDEVGELAPTMQARLLRVLEARCVRPVGGTQEKPVDVRFVAATNRDLKAECAAGRFRPDLHSRLNGISLTIPPLRERPEEIDALAQLFLERAVVENGLSTVPTLSPEARALLRRCEWPDNVRGVRNAIDRAVLLCDGATITPGDLLLDAPTAADDAEPGATASARGPLSAKDKDDRDRVLDTLEGCLWNQSEAARQLGMSRKALIARIEKYDLPRPRKGRGEG
jgi:DNA-binding NtrC family response regulator